MQSIDINGVWFPEFQNSWNFEKLQLQAALKLPLPLIAATGKFYGLYLMESLSQTEEFFNANTAEAKQSFSLKLKGIWLRFIRWRVVLDVFNPDISADLLFLFDEYEHFPQKLLFFFL